MFASIIRRKRGQSYADDQAAFDSTTFSLTTAVPRPAERRSDEQLIPLLKVAKLVSDAGERLMRVRNISAGGVMGEVADPPSVGEQVALELSSQKIPEVIPSRCSSVIACLRGSSPAGKAPPFITL